MKTQNFRTSLISTGLSLAVITSLQLTFFSGTVQADVNSGLIAYYPFDGGATDASGHGFNGANRTGLVQYNSGRIGLAAWFDGQSCLQLPQPRLLDGASNATISAWIYLASDHGGVFGTGGGQIIGAGDGRHMLDPITTRINVHQVEDARFEQVVNGSQSLLGFDNGDALPGLSIQSWHLFTMVLESQPTQSVFRGYLDGVLVRQAASAAPFRIAYDTDMPPLVGALEAAGPWQFWNGGIDDLRIYNRALSQSEIISLVPEPATGAIVSCGILLGAILRAPRRKRVASRP